MDEISKAKDLTEINTDSNVNFKIETKMTDMPLMEDIMENSLLGFKSKRMLNNFTQQGDMYFYYNPDSDYISIALLGNFKYDDTVKFINNLSYEYMKTTNQLELYEEIKPKSSNINKKTQKITTNMKNKDMIENIMKNSYLGYSNKTKYMKFLNKGEIIISKNKEDALDIIFIGNYEKNEINEFAENLNDEYTSLVQEQTYTQIIEKIKENNYSIESEVIDNQDSVVLTINI